MRRIGWGGNGYRQSIGTIDSRVVIGGIGWGGRRSMRKLGLETSDFGVGVRLAFGVGGFQLHKVALNLFEFPELFLKFSVKFSAHDG